MTKKTDYGMPGVFLFAHAINQVIQGYYHKEINDEWELNMAGGGLSLFHLESILYLLIETIGTCLILYGVWVVAAKKTGRLGMFSFMGLSTVGGYGRHRLCSGAFRPGQFFLCGPDIFAANQPGK